MSWLERFRRRADNTPTESLNIDKVLADGLRDRESAREAMRLLNRERASVVRTMKQVERRSNHMTSGSAKMMTRAAGSSPAAVEQFRTDYSLALQQAASTAGLNADAQTRSLEERLEIIDQARDQLSGFMQFGS